MVDMGFCVIRHTFLEEVCFALKGDHVHKVERVGGFIYLLTAQGGQKTVSYKFNVLAHEVLVHTDQIDG